MGQQVGSPAVVCQQPERRPGRAAGPACRQVGSRVTNRDNNIQDLRSQLQSLNDLLDSRDRECQDQKRLINEDSSAIALLRGDLATAQDLNAKLRDQVSLANADVDRLQVQNTRLQSDQREHLDKLSLERADKDMLNRRIVELIDSNEAARLDARRKDDELVVKERLANDAASQLLALHGELQDAKVRADRHREDVATLSKLTEEERLRAIRAQQRAEEAEREKRDRELQAEYLRREADNARLEKSRILDEKLGQDEELFALRDHVEVVHDRNREVGFLANAFSTPESSTALLSKTSSCAAPSTAETVSATSNRRTRKSSAAPFARWRWRALAQAPRPSALPVAATDLFPLKNNKILTHSLTIHSIIFIQTLFLL